MALALDEYNAGRWAEARALFLRGHALMPSARTWRVVGMTAFNLERYPDALHELSAALTDPRSPLAGRLRRQVQNLLDRTDTYVGRYRALLEPADAQLRVDGAKVELESDGTLLLPLGDHVLAVDAPGYVSTSRRVVVDGNDGDTLRFHLEPVPEASPPFAAQRWSVSTPLSAEFMAAPAPAASVALSEPARAYHWSWLTAGCALAFGTTAGALHVNTLREADRVENRCQGTCDPWDGETTKRDRLARWSQGTLSASLGLVATAVVLYFVERKRARQ
jgi:hypothetical protein